MPKIDQVDPLLLPQIGIFLKSQVEMYTQTGEFAHSSEAAQLEFALWSMAKRYNNVSKKEKCELLAHSRESVGLMRELIERIEKEIDAEEAKLLTSEKKQG